MTQNYKLILWSEAQSPITHMRGTEGNEAIINRSPVDTPDGRRDIPCLSGNALRHRCVREPGSFYLITAMGMKGKLSLQQFNFLLHGGTLTESSSHENTALIAEMQELFPLLRLVGGSLPNQIVRGSLLAIHGMLVCRENLPHLPLPPGYELPQNLKPSEHFVGGYQYVRGDGTQLVDWHSQGEADSSQMIYSGQQVIRGSVFLHGFQIPHGSDLEYGCLIHSLSLWQESGGTIGGMAGRGHGRLRTSILGDDHEAARCAELYVKHVAEHATKCADWLRRAFDRQPKKKAK